MKERKWTSQQKLQIVLEGLKGKVTVAEICNQNQVSMNQYYKWRDRLLSEGTKIYEYGGIDRSEERYVSEIKRLKEIIGDLTMELKKNEK